jgi:F420-non-reducing hydrogenase small subunit
MTARPKAAFYWCSSCGGCEEAVVDLHERLLDVVAKVDLVLWPVALDFKYRDVEALAPGEITVSFVNGAIRTDEQLHLARMLRQKSGLLIAFGSCAHLGGVPGLANLTDREAILREAYLEGPSVVNPERTLPQKTCRDNGHELSLPSFWKRVYRLDEAVEVDFYLPGCPPPPELLAEALEKILTGTLPPRGAVLAPEKALCDTCPRRGSKNPSLRLARLYRPHEVVADPEVCFLDQGIVCCGPATRSGCGERCIRGHMPCTGCFGPPPGVSDQGARLATAIASLFAGTGAEEAEALSRQVVDPVGTFHRYGVPASLLAGRLPRRPG